MSLIEVSQLAAGTTRPFDLDAMIRSLSGLDAVDALQKAWQERLAELVSRPLAFLFTPGSFYGDLYCLRHDGVPRYMRNQALVHLVVNHFTPRDVFGKLCQTPDDGFWRDMVKRNVRIAIDDGIPGDLSIPEMYQWLRERIAHSSGTYGARLGNDWCRSSKPKPEAGGAKTIGKVRGEFAAACVAIKREYSARREDCTQEQAVHDFYLARPKLKEFTNRIEGLNGRSAETLHDDLSDLRQAEGVIAWPEWKDL